MKSDYLYITNPTGTLIKAVIRNLFDGALIQDRNNLNDLYFYNGYYIDGERPTWKLNLFNNSPLAIPH